MTELAYLVDIPSAYVRTFRAKVTARPPGAVVLDRTFFYPAGGGQPCDRGTLRLDSGRSFDVVDVVKSGPSVVHRLRRHSDADGSLAVGAEVEGTIDWDRRLRHMRLHTAQHLLSARVFARSRLRTRRAVLAEESATLDLEGDLPSELVPELARDLAEAAEHGRGVTIRTVPRGDWDRNPFAERTGLVPLPPQVDPVRVVEIDTLDVCPCGGTHVSGTREIGAIRLAPLEPAPGGGSRLRLTLVDVGTSTPHA